MRSRLVWIRVSSVYSAMNTQKNPISIIIIIIKRLEGVQLRELMPCARYIPQGPVPRPFPH